MRQQRVDHYRHVLNSGICIAKFKGFRDVTIKLASSSTLHFAPDPANFSLAVSPTLCSFIDSGVAVGSLNFALVF